MQYLGVMAGNNVDIIINSIGGGAITVDLDLECKESNSCNAITVTTGPGVTLSGTSQVNCYKSDACGTINGGLSINNNPFKITDKQDINNTLKQDSVKTILLISVITLLVILFVLIFIFMKYKKQKNVKFIVEDMEFDDSIDKNVEMEGINKDNNNITVTSL